MFSLLFTPEKVTIVSSTSKLRGLIKKIEGVLRKRVLYIERSVDCRLSSCAKRFIATNREYTLIFKDGWCLPRCVKSFDPTDRGAAQKWICAKAQERWRIFRSEANKTLSLSLFPLVPCIEFMRPFPKEARSNKLGLDFRPLEHFFCPLLTRASMESLSNSHNRLWEYICIYIHLSFGKSWFFIYFLGNIPRKWDQSWALVRRSI